MNEIDDIDKAELLQVYPDATFGVHGNQPVVLIPNLKLPVGWSPDVVRALLAPFGMGGYTSRLFFAQKPSTPKQMNWNGSERIADEIWVAYSYNTHGRGQHGRLSMLTLITMHLGGAAHGAP